LLVVLPWVSSVDVEPTPPWLLPGPSNVVHVTVPCVFVQLSGNGAADADIAEPPTNSIVIAAVNRSLRITFIPWNFPTRAPRSLAGMRGASVGAPTVEAPARDHVK
jgi:hypothetical protein